MPIEKQDVSYKSALGLDSDPFSPVANQDRDQRFYYAFEAFEQRLTLLKRLVRGKDVLILVIGERGSGKTTLLNRYLAAADVVWEKCRLRTPSTDDPKRRQQLKNLNNRPAYLLKDAGDPVIIVDDAHELTRIELQFLLQDALAPGSNRKVKRLVLVGESGLNATFASLAAKVAGETAVNKIYLPSISVAEAGAYLHHRLAVAGYAGKNPFSASVIKKLHSKTAGLPGKINASAHGWLKQTYTHDSHSRGISSWIERRRLLLLGGAAAGVCALGLTWILSMSDRNASSRQTAHPESTPRIIRVKIPPESRIIRPKSEIAATPSNIEKHRPAVIVAESEKKTAPEKIPPPPTVTAPQTHQSTQVKSPVAPKTAAVKKEGAIPVKKVPSSNTAAIKKKSPATNTADQKPAILREKWLLEQDPTHYTIQILAVRREKSLLKFIAETRLNDRGRIAYFRAKLKGENWYRLLYGVYPSRKDADSALNNLPSNIRQLSPWIRRMAPIQRAIRENDSR